MDELIEKLETEGVVSFDEIKLMNGVTVDVEFFRDLFSPVEDPTSYEQMVDYDGGYRGYKKDFDRWKELGILT